MNITAQIIATTVQSVMRWIRDFYNHKDLPQPQKEVQEIELDEMPHFLAKKRKDLDLENVMPSYP